MEDIKYMKRKIVMLMIVTLILMGIMACGSNNQDSADQPEPVVQESPESENSEEGDMPSEAMSEESSPEPEEIVEEENIPYWYMDSEGIKNEELGVIIKKDTATTNNFKIEAGIFMRAEDESDHTSYKCRFECGYYEGDLDACIEENLYANLLLVRYDEIKKGKIGELDYAYGEDENTLAVLIVDSGIVFAAEFSSKLGGAEEQISRILESEEESCINSLAYITDDGFHIPVLGIMIPYTGNGGRRDFDEDIYVLGESSSGSGIRMYIYEGKNIQKDILLENLLEYETSVIDETVEINIGKFQYLGTGFTQSNNSETWYFDSEDARYYIRLDANANAEYNGGDYKDYIYIIESLE